MNSLFKCTEMSASIPSKSQQRGSLGELALKTALHAGPQSFVHAECTYSTSFFRFRTSPSKAQSNLSI